jgi:hypothetical protein
MEPRFSCERRGFSFYLRFKEVIGQQGRCGELTNRLAP